MIIVPGLPPLQETRHSRELSRRIHDAVRDYQRANPDTTEADVRTALLRSAPAGGAPDVVRRRRVAATAVAAAAVGAFTATARAGGKFDGNTTMAIVGIVAVVAAIAFAIIRIGQRD